MSRALGRVVVDTNVVSYLLDGSKLGAQYADLLLGCNLCIAFVTAEELFFGAEKRGWGARRRAALDSALSECTLLAPNWQIARLSGLLRAGRMRIGRVMQPADAWIAATAMWYELPLVTHDGDFGGLEGLDVMTLREPRNREPVVSYAEMRFASRAGASGAPEMRVMR